MITPVAPYLNNVYCPHAHSTTLAGTLLPGEGQESIRYVGCSVCLSELVYRICAALAEIPKAPPP